MIVGHPLRRLLALGSRDLGVDLGTTNTLVHLRGRGVVINEPSLVAVDPRSRAVKAVGAEALPMLGKTPGDLVVVRPLRSGVVADFGLAAQMLTRFLERARLRTPGSVAPRPRVLIGVPAGISPVEVRAARESALSAHAAEAFVVEEPLAAAIGAGLPIAEPVGSLIVDIGGGTTEVALIALGAIVVREGIPVGGEAIDRAIVQYARRAFDLVIGERMAERAKLAAGSAAPLEQELTVVLRGRSLLSGLPKAVEVSSVELRDAIRGPVDAIAAAIRRVLEQAPPELLTDILTDGIVLCGGGALLRGIDRRIATETRIPVRIADDPLACVARGAGAMVEELQNPAYHALLSRAQATRSIR